MAQDGTFTATVSAGADAVAGYRSLIAETDDGVYLTPIQILVRPVAPDIAIGLLSPNIARSGLTTSVLLNCLGSDKPRGFYFLRNGLYDPTVLVSGLQQTEFPTVFGTKITVAADAPPGDRTLVAVTARGVAITNDTLTILGP